MTFDLQPTLRGTLLELRPLRREDFDDLFTVAADPLIWEQHPASNRYQPAVFRIFFDEALNSGGALIALDTVDGRVAYDPASGQVEIGWTFLARSHWGGRHNAEMKHLMLEHAFRFVDRVVFVVGIHNRRSQRAIEKIGAVRVGSRPDANGHDSFVYEITAGA